MSEIVYINFPLSGGIKLFSDCLISKAKSNSIIYYQCGGSILSRLKIIKFFLKKNVWFSNNNIFIYLFICISPYRPSIILHDHKLRKGYSKKEYILNFLFKIFSSRFKSIIIHSEDAVARKLLTMPNVVYLQMPPHFYMPNSNNKSIKLNSNNSLKLLCFGRIEKYKNFEFIAKAVSNIDNVQLTIAGQGSLSSELKNIIDCSNNIFLLNDYISNEAVYDLFENHHYLVLPYESLTQTGLIDMSCAYNKPVIISNIPEFDKYRNKAFVRTIDITKNLDFNVFMRELNYGNSEYLHMKNACVEYYKEQEKTWEKYVSYFISN